MLRADRQLGARRWARSSRTWRDRRVPEFRDAHVEQVVGETRAIVGEPEAALDCFPLALGADGTIPRALGWRMIAAHHRRDDLDLGPPDDTRLTRKPHANVLQRSTQSNDRRLAAQPGEDARLVGHTARASSQRNARLAGGGTCELRRTRDGRSPGSLAPVRPGLAVKDDRTPRTSLSKRART
jgi:hypothetical protein